MVQETRNIRREVLPNGLTILTEEMLHIRSVSIGIWIKTGSRHEDPQVNGISHFLEHMVFKGTTTRSAEAIAREIPGVQYLATSVSGGGQVVYAERNWSTRWDAVNADGRWSWQSARDASMMLEAGRHTIRFLGAAGGVNLDRIILTADEDCVPAHPGHDCGG